MKRMQSLNFHATHGDAARLQTAIGLGCAAGIILLWLATQLYGVLFLTLEGWNWLATPVLIAVQTWSFVGLFIIAHDAMHGSLAPRHKQLSDAIGRGLLFLYAGFGWSKLRAAHFAHHKHAGTAGDPDFDAAHPDRFGRWYLTFLKRYFGPLSLVYVVTITWGYILIAGANPVNVTLFYGVPAIASSFQLFYFGTFRPHRHEAGVFADRHNARSLHYSWVGSLFSCFHFGYHHEHHLAPGVPWWALPAEYRARKDG